VGKVRAIITMSLDGYVAGPDQTEENPLGVGGEELHEWMFPLKVWRESHGDEGGEVTASSPVVERWSENVGAMIMGRNMFGGGPGPWGEDPWTGWWGDNPPYHVPVFVLTHHEREPLEMEGDTTFHFVTEGIESALDRAREAAAEADITVIGGANAIQQYVAAGLVDELEISISPRFLGGGERLFDNVDGADIELEQLRAVEGLGVTHISYRVVKG
jgi:dihydrofolate reductase